MAQQIKPLSQERIGRALRALGINKMMVDEKLGFLFIWGKHPSSNLLALVTVGMKGAEQGNPVLAVLGRIIGLAPTDPNELLARANEWNKSMPWPRAYVVEGKLWVDYRVDLKEGVSESQLRNFLETFFASLSLFFTWIEGEDVLESPFTEPRLLG